MCESCDWEEWDKQAGQLLEKLEDLPERANDFAIGVEEKVEDMRTWANKNKHVTQPMRDALDNMASGVERWLDRS